MKKFIPIEKFGSEKSIKSAVLKTKSKFTYIFPDAVKLVYSNDQDFCLNKLPFIIKKRKY